MRPQGEAASSPAVLPDEPQELLEAFTELERADAGLRESLGRVKSWKLSAGLLLAGVSPLLILLVLSHR